MKLSQIREGVKALIEANRDPNPGNWRSQLLGLVILIVVVTVTYGAGRADGRASAEAELPQVQQLSARIDQLRDRMDHGWFTECTDFRGSLGSMQIQHGLHDLSGSLGRQPVGDDK